MLSSQPQLMRTTVVQAFARTMVDDSRRTALAGHGGGSGPRTDPEPPRSSLLPAVEDIVGGHYHLKSLLGEGMFGKVYVAQRLDVPEHRVALKLLPRSLYAGRNVERELVMLATVGHPHVVQLKDHGTTPDYVWLTMPVYQGQTLAERLAQGTLSCRQAYDIFLPIARGLEALHAAGLRHQDVKPENIFLAVFGGRVHPILLDLGVAAEKDAGFIAGTALFAAPEQVAALAGVPTLAPFSEKMDTYGLASTLLYALVGPDHFPGETANDRVSMTEAQRTRIAEPLAKGALPEATGPARKAIAAALRRFLAFEPEDRPTMREVCEELDVLLEPDREVERRLERKRARQKSTITWLGVGLTAMMLAGAAGGVVAFQKRETLRVADELAQARREGAASFDKLDTCVASHRMATKENAACKAALDVERTELRRSLDDVIRTGSQTEAEHAHEVQRYNTRIKACEDTANAQKRTCEDEMTRAVADRARERAELVADRDAARVLADQEKSARAAAEGEREACRAEGRVLREERDTARAAAKAAAPAIPAAPHAPAAPGSAAPIAPVTGDPALPPDLKPIVPAPVPQQPAQAQPEQKAVPPQADGEPKGS
ncbi:serine/threonine protein kinase [Minicystis rosea]|nr:serine/threonine protein kinase [Minicystis rosea]